MKEILARLRAFNTFRTWVKLYGNVCQKAWAQMAISIISPYLVEGQKAVLLCLSKVLHELFLKIIFPTGFSLHLGVPDHLHVNSMQHM